MKFSTWLGPVHESCTRNCGKLVEHRELNDGRTLDEAIDIDSSEKFCQPANKCVRNGPVTLYTLHISGCVSIKGYLLQAEGGGVQVQVQYTGHGAMNFERAPVP